MAALAALLAGGAGCAAAAPYGAVRRDSAGVVIVENRAPAWGRGGGWRLDAARAAPLGGPAAGDLTALVALSGGGFAVADARGRVSWHDRRGRETRTAILPGSPAVGALFARAGGGLVAWDPDRLAAVDVGADGRAGPARSYESVLPRGSVAALGAFSDGSVLVSVRDAATFTVSALPARDTVPLFRLGPATAHARILTVPGPEELTWGGAGGAIRIAAPFARDVWVAVSGDRAWVADGVRGELRAYDQAGRLRSIVRAPIRGEPVDPAEVAGWRERLRRLARGHLPDDERLRLEGSLVIPSSWPPFAALLAGPRGELWVRAGSAPGRVARWNVFDATGRWLGEILVSPQVEVTAVGDGYVIATREERVRIPLSINRGSRELPGSAR